ncbi:ABATE domain-containing protein [Actinoplanes sp. NPDC049548]|uniref:CGNR zinc finger domain-containing protein n=1 Tax=Actinoplanes sp. NPDC049548 TaxID=3155152 RepID=UPI00342C9D70
MKEIAVTAPDVPPAPGAEQHPALDFANSAVTVPGGQVLDALGTPESATRWLIDHGLAPSDARLHEVCAGRLRSLRDATRSLLKARVRDEEPPREALAAVNAALARVPTASVLRWDPGVGLHRATSHPTDQVVDHALGVLAADAAELLTGPDAPRLAACDSPPCSRYLLRSGRRQWCSVRCGDRVRAARAYARRTRPETV